MVNCRNDYIAVVQPKLFSKRRDVREIDSHTSSTRGELPMIGRGAGEYDDRSSTVFY